MVVRACVAVVVIAWMLSGASPAWADDVVWMTDANQAWEAAVQQKRPLLIFVTMPRCHYCTLMKNQTLRHPDVVQRLKDGYIALTVDTAGSAELVRALKVNGFPTTIVVSQQKRKIVKRVKGYVSPQEFSEHLAELD